MKDVRLIWGSPQEDSFMKLKELVTSALVLVLPDNNLPFRLVADGSGIAVVNGVLLPSIALNCLPGCYTRIFNCSGILD
jgi:hypothetical protein